MHADPQSTKNTDSLIVFFALLGSVRVKASNKHVDEIDHRSISSTCLRAAFKCANAMALNFYLTNNATPNFTRTLN